MKKLALVAAISLLSTTAAQAEEFGMAGCGLGSLLFEPGSTFTQILAATTNGTLGNQTFGITSGTSNCTKQGVILTDKEQEAFVEANYAQLQQDMATGQGEHLAAFTGLLGCDSGVHGQVATFAQSNYDTVFPTDATTPMQALYTFKMAASQDASIANSCARL
jgi:hypothetical protein